MKKVKSRVKELFVIVLITGCAAAMGTISNKIQVNQTDQNEYYQVMHGGLPEDASMWDIFKAVVIYAWESTRPVENPCDDNPKLCTVGAPER